MLFYIQARGADRKDLSLFVREENLNAALLAFAEHHGAVAGDSPVEVRTRLRGILYRVFRVDETLTGVLPWDDPDGLERLEDSEAWGDD